MQNQNHKSIFECYIHTRPNKWPAVITELFWYYNYQSLFYYYSEPFQIPQADLGADISDLSLLIINIKTKMSLKKQLMACNLLSNRKFDLHMTNIYTPLQNCECEQAHTMYVPVAYQVWSYE